MKFHTTRTYDAVVVGSGMGGLGAAVELAKNGASTLLLEQHNLPGGYATSFVRGRFEFEPSLHELGSAGLDGGEKRGLRRYFEDEIGADIELCRVPEAYRLILTERNVDITVPFGVDNFVKTIAARVPGSGEVTRRYLDLCREIVEALDFLGTAGTSVDKRRLLREYGNFLRTTPYTMKEVADALGVPKSVRELIYPYFCYVGVPESRQSFMLFAAMLYSYIAYGAVVPRLRSHEISSALVAKFEEYGGTFEVNTRVERIMAENGMATGVETSRGDRIVAPLILSNAGPPLVYGGLLSPGSEVPDSALRNIQARTLGPSGFVVYLGLSKSPEELKLQDYTYFISPHMDTDKIYNSLGKLGGALMQAAICLNAAVPDCSPPGTTILSLTTLYLPGAWDQVTPESYFETKNKLAEAMIDQFEKATGILIRGSIEEYEVASPQTFARYTSTYDGSIYAWEPEPWDSIVPRALSEADEQYIKGLYFCGGYGYRTHGFSGSLFCRPESGPRRNKKSEGGRTMKVTVKGPLRDLLAFFLLRRERRRRFDAANTRALPAAPMNELSRAIDPETLVLKITAIQDETADTKTFRLARDGGGELPFFRAGQYISVKETVGGSAITRPYSISSVPAEALDPGFYEITIRQKEGFFTEHVNGTWRVGTEVICSGPLGQFYYEQIRDGESLVCIAGGCGITPFKSMIPHILNGRSNAKITLFYGIADSTQIIFKEYLDRLEAGSRGALQIIYVNSGLTDCSAGCENGLISREIISRYVRDVSASSFLLCGPEAMYMHLLSEFDGIECRGIRLEAPGDGRKVSSRSDYPRQHIGRSYSIEVQIRGETRTIPAAAGETVLVAVERAGIGPPSECRSGECGYCRSKLNSGEIYGITEHDGRREADRKFGYFHPCSSYPLSDLVITVP